MRARPPTPHREGEMNKERKKNMSKRTFEQWLIEAQGLRRDALAAETKLLAFLVEFEESGAWQDGGFNTFAMLIRQYKLTRPERLEEFKIAQADTKNLPTHVIDVIGSDATIQAGKIKDPKVRADYVKEAKLRVEQDGFPWSPEQAERARVRVQPDPPKPLMRVERMSKAERDLAEAEAVIETLKAENAELKKENRELKKRLGKKQPGSDQPRA